MRAKIFFKRIFCTLFAFVTILCCGLLLSACGSHTCTFSEEWEKDETHHWHECIDADCDKISDYDVHDWEEDGVSDNDVTYICAVCGYTKTENVFTISFSCEQHASVIVYDTQDVSGEGQSITSSDQLVCAKDGETGAFLNDGNGQVNFRVVLEAGYVVNDISIEGSYNKLKNEPTNTEDNVYRITKIASNLSVTITTLAETEMDGYAVKFLFDNGAKVYVCDKQYDKDGVEFDGGYLANSTEISSGDSVYPRNSETGAVLIDGTGQVNFIIIVEDGYDLEISISNTDGTLEEQHYKNLKNPDETLVENVYRVTKISGGITITINLTVSA